MTRDELDAQIAAETRALAAGLAYVLSGQLPLAVLPDLMRLSRHAAFLAAVSAERAGLEKAA